MSLADDLREEGQPEPEFHAGVAARMPRKRTSAGAMIRDTDGRTLFVVPNYRPWLEIPGGVVEDDESPLAGCHREIVEEIGLEVTVGRLLVVDWVPAQGVWTDSIAFVFDGGVVDAGTVARMTPADDELVGLTFLTLDEAHDRLRPSQRRRLSAAVEALATGQLRYIEFGRPS